MIRFLSLAIILACLVGCATPSSVLTTHDPSTDSTTVGTAKLVRSHDTIESDGRISMFIETSRPCSPILQIYSIGGGSPLSTHALESTSMSNVYKSTFNARANSEVVLVSLKPSEESDPTLTRVVETHIFNVGVNGLEPR
jgi:hypothetical protein